MRFSSQARKRTTSKVLRAAFTSPRILLVLVLTLIVAGAITGITNPFKKVNSAAALSLPTNIVPKTSYPCASLGGDCYSVVVGNSVSGTLGVPVAFIAGLQDRTEPQVYLLGDSSSCNPGNGNQDAGSGLDRCWLNYIEENYPNIHDTTVSENFILSHYQNLVTHGGKVWLVEYSSNDPNFPLEYDMARTIGSADSALPVPSSAYSSLVSIFGASNVYLEQNLTAGEGPSNCYSQSDPMLACDQWLLSQFPPGTGTNPNVLATPCNGRFTSTDYYAFTNPLEVVLQSECTNALSSNELSWVTGTLMPLYGSTSPTFKIRSIDVGYTGFGGEVPTVNVLSAWQVLYVVMEDDMNLGFMAGLPDYTNAQQTTQPAPTYNSSQVYIAFSYTQGNGIMWYQYRYLPIYNDSLRSSVIANWQVNGMMAEIAPPILKYWTESEPSDGDQYIITANSGSGSYLHPEEIPNEEYWATAIATPFACNADQPVNFAQFNNRITQSSMQSYANAVSGSAQNIASWAPDTNGNPTGTYPAYDTGSDPAFYQLNGGVVAAINDWWVGQTLNSQTAQQQANQIAQDASAHDQHFFYINFNAGAGSLAWLQEVYNDLNAIQANKYVPVTFNNYFTLYDEANSIKPAADPCSPIQTTGTSSASTTQTASGSTTSSLSTYTTVETQTSTIVSNHSTITTTITSTAVVTGDPATSTSVSTSSGRSDGNVSGSQLPGSGNAIEAAKMKAVAGTMGAGTSATVFLAGLFPMSYILKNSGKSRGGRTHNTRYHERARLGGR